MKKILRNSFCGNISNKFLNKNIILTGWINSFRNHGSTIFINLRDKTGLIQLVFKNFNKKKKNFFLKTENCISIKGFLVIRNLKNFNIYTYNGFKEIYCYNIFIINIFFFPSFNYNDYYLSEIIRLKNRYLDLRGVLKQNNLKFRFNLIKYFRNFFNKELFIDIETPFLVKSFPEGSRDFIIPSRFYFNKFYALPQSPQIFKQLLMISCFDRYYQIVKCFRDEDFRKNRHPEFTQLDFEVSFLNNFDIIYLTSYLILFIFFFFFKYKILGFKFIKYIKCIDSFFIDKPDTRINIKYYNLNILFKYKFFLEKKILNLVLINFTNFYKLFGKNFYNFYFFIYKNIIINFFFKKKKKYFYFYLFDYSNKYINNYLFFFKSYYNYNYNKDILVILIFNKFFLNLFIFFINLFCFSIFGIFNKYINYYYLPLWILNFPLFEYNYLNKKYNYLHNPFSIPINFDKLYLDFLPIKSFSNSYDIIINGNEIGGGSVRNDKIFLQKRIFFILNYKNWESNFYFFFKALNCSPPIHCGIALGIDRLLIIFLPINSIKDIIAFPKTQKGCCLLTNTPSLIDVYDYKK